MKGNLEERDQDLRPKKGQKVVVNIEMVHLNDAMSKLNFARETDFAAPACGAHAITGPGREVLEKFEGRVAEGDFVVAVDMALQLMHVGAKVAIRAMVGAGATFVRTCKIGTQWY